ncbi:MAG TPA: putative CRISPR-associated protein, partial [Leptolyngbyaceae cyanobacterium M65_K2018_010]|nr:putative CRISPR-associated protein [Leptolyngbyaceae cyanobacterium M65_K2018_010]
LVRIGIDASDRVLLCASETPDGHCCALAVKHYLEKYWPGIIVEAEPIKGLQVSDANRFKNEGVIEFIKKALTTIDAYSNVILNPTGGYKALVPYTVLLGMIKGVKCDYIFEQSTSLLELPPLPLEFNRSQFEAYKDLFEDIERNTAIPRSTWEQRVPYEERTWFEPLVEMNGNDVTLSAVGFLFLEVIRKPSALVPFLSQKAIKDVFQNLASLDNCDPFRFLRRVSQSDDAFQQAVHINNNTGLYWLKPGRTTDRYLVSKEGWRLLVWRAIREDQEGSQYPSKVIVNPDKDRGNYAPFMRMEFVE